MSFIGLVTRKEKPTGVSLMAKVVTANKKKSAKKIFKVTVKANGLDDFSCCVIDHGTAIDKINLSQDMSQIVDDIVLTYSGIHDTSISYRIIDVDTPYLSTYLGEDGKVKSRPKYGEGSATGYIEITVTKNEASVTSRIQASVKSITAEEVLNDTTFTQAGLWKLIKGGNESYQQGNEMSGHNNIYKQLTLINSKSVDTMSTEPVAITWEVQDETLSYTSNIYTEPRINVSTGEVSRCSYKEACTLVDNISGVTVKVIGNGSDSLQNYVRIGGLILTAKISLGAATKNIVFNCSTTSKYITSAEVIEVIVANIYIIAQDGSRIAYKTVADSKYNTIMAPAEGGTYTLQAFGLYGGLEISAPTLKVEAGKFNGVSISNSLLDFNGSNAYENTDLYINAFNSGFQDVEEENNNRRWAKLVINLDALKDADSDDKQFACLTTVSVSGYSETGDTLGGGTVLQKVYTQFKVDTSAMTA